MSDDSSDVLARKVFFVVLAACLGYAAAVFLFVW